jgi:hypothetical protein
MNRRLAVRMQQSAQIIRGWQPIADSGDPRNKCRQLFSVVVGHP